MDNESPIKKNSITEVNLIRKFSYSSVTKKKRKLPVNFFENILDLELILKREFSMEKLNELVNIYSVSGFNILLNYYYTIFIKFLNI